MTDQLTIESENLLDQAAGFARGGDFLGAQARARFASQKLVSAAASRPATDKFVIAARARIDFMIVQYDALVQQWQTEVEARHTAYVSRERGAIDPASPPPSRASRAK